MFMPNRWRRAILHSIGESHGSSGKYRDWVDVGRRGDALQAQRVARDQPFARSKVICRLEVSRAPRTGTYAAKASELKRLANRVPVHDAKSAGINAILSSLLFRPNEDDSGATDLRTGSGCVVYGRRHQEQNVRVPEHAAIRAFGLASPHKDARRAARTASNAKSGQTLLPDTDPR